MQSINNFINLDETALPEGYQPLTALPLAIVVGLTGVGKTTTLDALSETGLAFALLPNRRTVADQITIAAMQRAQGQPIAPVQDRVERFKLTALYREHYPGGMAHALSRMAIAPPANLPFFDGLRGLDEIAYANEHFPQACFIVLDAPDTVRLSRLLTRGDHFDVVATEPTAADTALISQLQAIPDIEQVFDMAQLQQIALLSQKGEISASDIIKKTKIIVEERRNYDSGAAKEYLAHHGSATRVCLVDTTAHLPAEVAARIKQFLAIFMHR